MNTQSPSLEHLIDRLADDELDAAARRALFERLDAEPDGWRRCACALLEAQAWRAALSDERVPNAVPRSARWRPALGWAAGLLVAFSLGWAARSESPPARVVSPMPTRAPAPVVQAAATALPRADAPPRPPVAPPVDSLQRRLRQRGFEVEQHTRLMAVGLKNGRRVAVPVEEVQVRYVGGRTL